MMPVWDPDAYRSNVFTPSEHAGPTLNPFALIGRLMGQPTHQDLNRQRSEAQGAIVGEALSTLSESVAAGKTPQQAILEFLKTPQGQNAFRSHQGAFGNILQEFTKMVTPPDPQAIQTQPGARSDIYQGGRRVETVQQPTTDRQNMGVPYRGPGKGPHNVPPGNVAIDPDTGQPIYANPTAEIQTFQSYTAGLPSTTVRELARLHAMPADQRPAVAEREISRMVSTGAISQEFASKFLGGLLEVKEAKGNFGDVIGHVVIDKSIADPRGGGANTTFIPMQQNPATTPAMPGAGITQDGRPIKDVKSDMFSVYGLGSSVLRGAANVAETASPRMTTEATADQARKMGHVNNLRLAINAIVANQQGLGTPKALVDQITAIFPEPGPTTIPETQMLPRAMQIRTMLENEIEQDKAVITDRTGLVAPKTKEQASARIQSYTRILRAMPTNEEMGSRLEMLSTGQANSSLSGRVPQIGEVITRAPQAVQEVGGAVQGTVQGQGAPQAAPQSAPQQPSLQPKPPMLQSTQMTPEARKALQDIPKMDEAGLKSFVRDNPLAQNPAIQNLIRQRALQLLNEKRGQK